MAEFPPRYTAPSKRKNQIVNGVKMCAMCQINPLPKGKIRYCSDECSKDSMVRAGFNLSWRLWDRDKGICADCGCQCEHPSKKVYSSASYEAGKHYAEVDHIIPVEEGGGSCGLDNLQTLCHNCHVAKSALQKKTKAEKRKSNG